LDNGMGLAFPASVPSGGSTSRSFLVTFSPTGTTPDLVGPSPTIVSPVNGSETTDGQVPMSGTAGTAAGDQPTVHVAIYPGTSASGSPAQSFDAPVAAGAWSGRPSTALSPGTYTASATQADDRGNTGTSGPATFTVRAAQPPPNPPPANPPASVPPPVPQTTGNVRTLSGRVCVVLPKQKKCTPIEKLTSIPVGSVVDATHGKVELTTAADANGHTQTGVFSGGQFLFTQANERRKQIVKGKDGKPTTRTITVLVTRLALRGGGDPSSCSKRSAGRRAVAARRRFSRHLDAKARGHFSTKGRYAAATVRGTEWTTRDDCAGTLVTVTLHAVLVNDFAKKKTVLVKAGHRYLATGHA
jgi:hypothetical protein